MNGKCFVFVLAVASMTVAIGCEGNSQLTGARVKGNVTYQGKVVTGGEIIFIDPNDHNRSQSGQILGDGTFDVPNVPVGEVVVVVDTEMARYDVSSFVPPKGAGNGTGNNPYLKDAPMSSTPPMKYMSIDKKFAKPETTTLKMKIQKGTNDMNFDLK